MPDAQDPLLDQFQITKTPKAPAWRKHQWPARRGDLANAYGDEDLLADNQKTQEEIALELKKELEKHDCPLIGYKVHERYH